jgi:hypothetical protein
VYWGYENGLSELYKWTGVVKLTGLIKVDWDDTGGPGSYDCKRVARV